MDENPQVAKAQPQHSKPEVGSCGHTLRRVLEDLYEPISTQPCPNHEERQSHQPQKRCNSARHLALLPKIQQEMACADSLHAQHVHCSEQDHAHVAYKKPPMNRMPASFEGAPLILNVYA
eukprot:CAMPEP_0178467948 /NCGR_PEP_ID=MMETSP0689_2-20121128/52671_1 /TAXON_ID=160604 /ORGANISM="Amphidinium massartii, Strain CS-259" /LENGTH=119 /DNA_ID=CAMNT_0020094997 /DNA_START=453 /DNA_END=812 /DNA_ORIENTATION=-